LLQPRDKESVVIAIKWLEELVMQPSYGFSTADTSHGDDVTECKSPKTVNVDSVRIKVERGALGGDKERRFVEFISEWILCFGHN